jgi:transcription initiation factor IIE alpha subunit
MIAESKTTRNTLNKQSKVGIRTWYLPKQYQKILESVRWKATKSIDNSYNVVEKLTSHNNKVISSETSSWKTYFSQW